MGTHTTVITKDDTVLIVSPSSSKILNRLKNAGDVGCSYGELHKMTKIPSNSLYVFSQRLRKSKLVRATVGSMGETRLVLNEHDKVCICKAKNIG